MNQCIQLNNSPDDHPGRQSKHGPSSLKRPVVSRTWLEKRKNDAWRHPGPTERPIPVTTGKQQTGRHDEMTRPDKVFCRGMS
jgi:hypothetical protein